MVIGFIKEAIRFSAFFLFGSAGEIITEKSGHLNMGIPGIMCLGAIGGVLGELTYLTMLNGGEINAFLCILFPIIFTLIFGALGGAIFAFFTVTLRCNQNVTGLTLTTFGAGLNAFILGLLGKDLPGNWSLAAKKFLSFFPDKAAYEGNWFLTIFCSHGILVYLAIIIAIIAALVINKTRVGLVLRAVGERPEAVDAMGLNVTAYRYGATMIGGAIAGLGGTFFIMDYLGGSFEYTIESYGWMAVAIVIFSIWKPEIAIFASFIFGVTYILPSFLNLGAFWQKQIIKVIPYIMTILVLIITSLFNRRETQPPAALGINYFREDR